MINKWSKDKTVSILSKFIEKHIEKHGGIYPHLLAESLLDKLFGKDFKWK